MSPVELNQRQSFILAILVLFLGRWLNRHVAPLREWNIPEPVTGGTMLAVLTRVAVSNLWIQNGVGIALANLLGANPATGLLAGSIGLSGGHGTAIAWAPSLKSTFDLPNATEIGTAAATFGLVAGGVLGGPLGRFLIRRHRLEPATAEHTSVGFTYAEEGKLKLDVDGMLQTLLVIAIAVGIGTQLNRLVAGWGFKLPEFVTALFSSIVLANVVPRLFPRIPWPTGTPPLALVADLSLGLFLAMSLMSLQLWTLLDVAGPLLGILIAQTVVCWGILAWVVFRLLGSTYDAAVSTSGYFGLALGATPTAIAVMTAITKAHGARPRSFIVVPLVGAFFVDIANAITIQTIIGLMGR